MAKKREIRTYTVSEVNTLARVALEERLPGRMVVAGEVSDWRRHHSGHCYFSLKDEGSQLACVMWASSVRGLKFSPENGMAVLATGHVEVYVPQGRYQFYADKLEPAGVGALQLAFEQMVRRLRAEGLFDEAHKKPIPRYPMRIGIVTSESGAAVWDIADSIYNRWPCARLFLCAAPVQGPGAAEKIAAAIRSLNRRNRRLKLDVLIVGRGGGSLEDLWAFNEEVVARAIYASAIPVISAVGHEVDVTIADLVADARASTPTKAGVIAVTDREEVLGRLAEAQRRLAGDVRRRVDLYRHQLATVEASAVFRNPRWIVHNASQMVDERSMRLAEAGRGLFAGLRERLEAMQRVVLRIEPHRLLGRRHVEVHELAGRLAEAAKGLFGRLREQLDRVGRLVARIEPHRVVGVKHVQVEEHSGRLRAAWGAVAGEKRLKLTALENRLEALDPRSVLKRGYSITKNARTGRVVTRAADVAVGDTIVTEFAERGRVESDVRKVSE
ncbi:MAG TPA: exodeoxyribonuclease VII large subunit [Anaerohalosphaeraceae bacterium]|jgi:exodeoxyribonuclease VII large subunit|nr:exodeoxyribonuclease VII large subunit [Anaerohalosphaeraceae bacterium]